MWCQEAIDSLLWKQRINPSAKTMWSFLYLARPVRSPGLQLACCTDINLPDMSKKQVALMRRGVAAGTCIMIDSSLFHTRLDGDGTQGRRLMHHTFARGGWLRTETGGWREPTPPNNPHNLFPKRLVAHSDPAVRRMFCLWSPTMCKFVASGFDPSYGSSTNRRRSRGHWTQNCENWYDAGTM